MFIFKSGELFLSDWIQFNERDNQGEWSEKKDFLKVAKL